MSSPSENDTIKAYKEGSDNGNLAKDPENTNEENTAGTQASAASAVELYLPRQRKLSHPTAARIMTRKVDLVGKDAADSALALNEGEVKGDEASATGNLLPGMVAIRQRWTARKTRKEVEKMTARSNAADVGTLSRVYAATQRHGARQKAVKEDSEEEKVEITATDEFSHLAYNAGTTADLRYTCIGKTIAKNTKETDCIGTDRDTEPRGAKIKAKSSGPELSPQSPAPLPPDTRDLSSKSDFPQQNVVSTHIDIDQPEDIVEPPNQDAAIVSNAQPGAFAVGGMSSNAHQDVESSLNSPSIPAERTVVGDYDARVKATIVEELESAIATPMETSGGRIMGGLKGFIILSIIASVGAHGMLGMVLFFFGSDTEAFDLAGICSEGFATIFSCSIACANKDKTVRGRRMKGSCTFHIAACVLWGIAIPISYLSYDDGGNRRVYFYKDKASAEFALRILVLLVMAAGLSCTSLLLCRIDGHRQCCGRIRDKVFFGSVMALIFLPVLVFIIFVTIMWWREYPCDIGPDCQYIYYDPSIGYGGCICENTNPCTPDTCKPGFTCVETSYYDYNFYRHVYNCVETTPCIPDPCPHGYTCVTITEKDREGFSCLI